MKPNTQKNSLMIGLFATMLALSIGSQNGALMVAAVPSAYAQTNAQSPNKSANPEFHETICHFPGGGTTPQTVIVGSPAVLEAHLNHGDLYGKCPILCPAGATSCVGADGTPGLVGYSSPAPLTPPSSHRELKGS